VAQGISTPQEGIRAIDQARLRMKLWLILPIAVLVVGVFVVHLRALIVPALILFVVLVKGATEHRALGRRKADLLNDSTP
jgi:hypothetical protein